MKKSNPRVLLISPYKKAELRVGQYFAPSIGVNRIASYIKSKSSAEVEVFDPDLQGEDKLYGLVRNNHFDIIGFSLLHPTLKNDLPLISKIKLYSPDSILLAGGQGAVFSIDFLLNRTPLQIIVKGFGEMPLLEIIKNINNGGTISDRFGDVAGLAIKCEDNTCEPRIFHTKPREHCTLAEFDEITSCFEFHNVPYEQYWEHMERCYSKKHLKLMKNNDLLRTVRIVTSSHCTNCCTFCSSTNFLRNGNGRPASLMLSPKAIIRVMKKCVSAHPTLTAIYFCDDNFLIDRERILVLCSLIKQEEALRELSFFCLSRVDNVDPIILKEMREAGFKFIIYGVESFSNKVLTDMNKRINHQDPAEKAKKAVLDSIEAGIDPLMNIILFYPTSDLADITQTIESTLDMVEAGSRITVYSYIEAYPGSHILNNRNLEFEYETFTIDGTEFTLPKLIMPFSKEVNMVARQSLDLREKLLSMILKKYNWKGVVPHPLYGLILFLAVYKLLQRDTSRIEDLIDRIMSEGCEIIEKQVEKRVQER